MIRKLRSINGVLPIVRIVPSFTMEILIGGCISGKDNGLIMHGNRMFFLERNNGKRKTPAKIGATV